MTRSLWLLALALSFALPLSAQAAGTTSADSDLAALLVAPVATPASSAPTMTAATPASPAPLFVDAGLCCSFDQIEQCRRSCAAIRCYYSVSCLPLGDCGCMCICE